jgi:hypothetical protein
MLVTKLWISELTCLLHDMQYHNQGYSARTSTIQRATAKQLIRKIDQLFEYPPISWLYSLPKFLVLHNLEKRKGIHNLYKVPLFQMPALQLHRHKTHRIYMRLVYTTIWCLVEVTRGGKPKRYFKQSITNSWKES